MITTDKIITKPSTLDKLSPSIGKLFNAEELAKMPNPKRKEPVYKTPSEWQAYEKEKAERLKPISLCAAIAAIIISGCSLIVQLLK